MADQDTQRHVHWKSWHTVAILVLLVGMALTGWLIPNRVLAWVAVLVIFSASIIVAGHGRNGLVRGAFVDERNKISLSRVQIVLWTIVILSAFITAALGNMNIYQQAYKAVETARAEARANNQESTVTFEKALVGVLGLAPVESVPESADVADVANAARIASEQPNTIFDALSITIPEELWLLMGITITALVGTPLIRSNKTDPKRQPSPDQTMSAISAQAFRQGVPESEIGTQGYVLFNKRPEESRFADLFETEEVGNASQLDIGKLQLFYFTFILLLVYTVLLGNMFSTQPIVTQLPALSASMLALLAISHAGYLGSKALPSNVNPTNFDIRGGGGGGQGGGTP